MVPATKLRCAGDTDPGLVRTGNEDRFYADADRGVFLVVDGVGGQAAGEKAAEVALEIIRKRLERRTGSAAQRIREGIAVANNEILRLAASNPDWAGMACVLTVAVVEEQSVTVGHVGDSRLYKIRSGVIRKITHDHSPVGEREDSREISEIEAMRHPRRNEVYRDLGSEQHAPDDPDFIEIIEMPFEFDGALLLCSDGLSDQVTSAEILKLTISHAGDPQAAVRALIRAANAAGGKDNVTVLIVEGPGFAASRVQPPARPASGLLRSRAAFFTYGFLTVLVLLFIFIRVQSKAPKAPSPPPGPRVLAVGSGYGRVEEAMRAAHPGDTVELPPGEYREAVRLREGVTLAAREPRAAVLMASPVAVTAENLRSGRIIGLRIQGDGQIPLATGILLTSSTVEVADCEISGATNAIEVQGASQALIRANALHDNTGSAILVRDLAAPRITHNEIARNGRNRRDPRAGITLTGPASPVITGNVFADNGGGPVAFPAGTDGSPVLKQNFILKPPPAGGSKR